MQLYARPSAKQLGNNLGKICGYPTAVNEFSEALWRLRLELSVMVCSREAPNALDFCLSDRLLKLLKAKRHAFWVLNPKRMSFVSVVLDLLCPEGDI